MQDSASEQSIAPATQSANKFIAIDKGEDSALYLKSIIKIEIETPNLRVER